MRFIKTYEDYTDEETRFYNHVSEKVLIYCEHFDKLFNIFGITSHRIHLKGDPGHISMGIYNQIDNGGSVNTERVSRKEYSCIIPCFLLRDDAEFMEPIGKTKNTVNITRIIFVKTEERLKEVRKERSDIIFLYDKLDDKMFSQIISGMRDFFKENVSNKIKLFNINDSLSTSSIIDFPVFRNVIIKYCNYLLTMNTSSLWYQNEPPEQLYKILYDELAKSPLAYTLMPKIKEKMPDVYNKFIEIGNPNKILGANKMGEMGF